MDTKTCVGCQKDKSLTDFIVTARGVPHVRCNGCKKAYELDYYHKNKSKCKKYRKKSSQKRFNTNMQFIADYLKRHPCIDCGEPDIVVLEFDHRSNKKYSIADMRDNYSLGTVKTEVSKCDVRCANCHRRKTAKERNYKILEFV